MSIRDRQIQAVESRVIDQALRDGHMPTLLEVQTALSRAFADRPLGRPTFRPVEAIKGERSDPETYNRMVQELRADLEIGYTESLYQGRRMMSLADYYETQKRRMQIELRALASEAGALLERIRSGSAGAVMFDGFTDFRYVEFDADPPRHIPATNCHVNLETGEALIDLAIRGTGVIDLTGARGRIKPQQAYRIEQVGSLDNLFSSNINEAFVCTLWQTSPAPVAVDLVVDVGRVIRANQIKMETQSPKQATVRLSLSVDDRVYHEVAAPHLAQPFTWSFTEAEFQYLKFTVIKETPDSSDGVNYAYRFGVKQVSAALLSFRDTACLVSRPHPVGAVLTRVSLISDAVIPPETFMRYYVAQDRPGEPLDWREIRSGEILDFGNIDTESVEINHTTLGYGTQLDNPYGRRLYQLHELPRDPRHLTLVQGDFMWQVETREGDGLLATHQPTLADWRDVPVYSTRFVPAERSLLTLTPGTLQRYTVWLFADSDVTEEGLPTVVTAGSLSVYLNNTLLKPVNGLYTYRLRAGWNQLQICTFTAGAGVLKPGVYLGGVASRVQARREPLVRADPRELSLNTSKFDRSQYALDGRRLVVAYDPLTEDAEGRGVRYSLEYGYTSEEARPADLRFMAIMGRKGQSTDATPRLRSYKLVVE